MPPHLPAPGAVIPTSTYRLQLQRGFGFREAAEVVDLLASLGVSHAYLSPVLQATPGSAHGYDVTDHGRLSDDLGGAEAWRTLVTAAREAGLGIVVDVVPNHMAVPVPESLKAALWDVLRHGPRSAYARWFDVDWDAHDGRVLMPVLGAPLGECMDSGELRRDSLDGEQVLRYHDHVLPLAPGTESLPLAELVDAQHYRLAFWRVGTEELNWRRFFDVTSLTAVRVEQPDVFDATHALLLRLVRDGDVDGLRIDHPDGLADPGGYLDRLADETGGRWVVAEKILESDEELPDDWRCAGTTGYDALNHVQRVFTDPAGAQPLLDLYTSLTGMPTQFETVVEDSKRLVAGGVLAAEVSRLVDLLQAVAGESPATRDTSRRWLREALVEVLVAFDVYRAYAVPGGGSPQHARRHVEHACTVAAGRLPGRGREIGWIGRVALGDESTSPAAVEFCTRFQQTTGPVMAKGVEDTAFYRWHRLAALNEVGGDPAWFTESPDDFHGYCSRLARDWPASQTTLSTHDTKRSEDVRARLLALAEMPVEWSTAVTSWRSRHRFRDPNLEYLFWQTLVGASPLSRQRALGYVEKAAREAKQHTSWTDPDAAYDAALHRFVNDVYDDAGLRAEVGDFVRQRVCMPGRVTALSQKLVQLTMPGVADVYQGSELWALSLVDPDNRRPVDYGERRALLAALDADDLALPPLPEDVDGVAKLVVTARTLRLRRRHPEWFGPQASYRSLPAAGPAAAHALAFVRGEGAVTVATRLPVGLDRAGGWGETSLALPEGEWRETFTGRTVSGAVALRDVLAVLPVALLTRL